MISRRDYLKISALAGAASLLPSGLLHAMHHEGLIRRAISRAAARRTFGGSS